MLNHFIKVKTQTVLYSHYYIDNHNPIIIMIFSNIKIKI